MSTNDGLYPTTYAQRRRERLHNFNIRLNAIVEEELYIGADDIAPDILPNFSLLYQPIATLNKEQQAERRRLEKLPLSVFDKELVE